MTQFLLFHWANKSSNSYHQFFHIKLFCLSSLVFETQIYSLSSSFSTLNSIENYYPEKINMEKMFSRSQHDRQQSTTDWSWWFFFSSLLLRIAQHFQSQHWKYLTECWRWNIQAQLSSPRCKKKVVCAEKFKSDEVIANLSPKNMEKWICRSEVWEGSKATRGSRCRQQEKEKIDFWRQKLLRGSVNRVMLRFFLLIPKKLVHFGDEEKMSQFGSMTTKVAHVGWQTRVRNFFFL